MDVILLEHIQGVGKMGDIVKVARGFGRNYLLPRNKALLANKANMEKFEAEKEARAAEMEAAKAQAAEMAGSFANISITLARQASDVGMLYGSVKARDISAALAEQNIDVPTAQVMIGDPIKEIGDHQVKVALHPEIIVDLAVSVERISQ